MYIGEMSRTSGSSNPIKAISSIGVVSDMDFILICTYEEDGKNPELVLYKKR